MLEVEPTCQRGRRQTGSRNGTEIVAAPLQKNSPGGCTVAVPGRTAVGGAMSFYGAKESVHVLYCFYLRTSVAFINKIIVIVIVI